MCYKQTHSSFEICTLRENMVTMNFLFLIQWQNYLILVDDHKLRLYTAAFKIEMGQHIKFNNQLSVYYLNRWQCQCKYYL